MRYYQKMAAKYRMDYLALVLLFSFGGALAKSKAELELSKTELREGDELTITCKITEKGRFDIARIYRIIDGVNGGPVESEISSNNGIATMLSDRYENIEYTPGKEVTIIKVRINGVTGRDAGKIGCTKLRDGEEAEESITVAVPPKSVKMFYLPNKDAEPEEIPDGGTITLKKGSGDGIMCKVFVDGTRDKPTTQILLGEGEGANDIIGRFSHKAQKEKLVWPSGLLNETRNDTYTWMKDPNPAETGQKITCVSELNEFDPVQTSATLDIHFQPEWTECDEFWQVKPGTKQAEITCKARMFPPGTTSTWTIGKMPNVTHLIDQDKDMAYSTNVKNLGGNIYEYVLTIDEIKEEHFDKKFKLVVENDIGSIEKKIDLQIDTRTTSTTPEPTTKGGDHPEAIPVGNSGSVNLRVAPLMVCLSFLLLLWHH